MTTCLLSSGSQATLGHLGRFAGDFRLSLWTFLGFGDVDGLWAQVNCGLMRPIGSMSTSQTLSFGRMSGKCPRWEGKLTAAYEGYESNVMAILKGPLSLSRKVPVPGSHFIAKIYYFASNSIAEKNETEKACLENVIDLFIKSYVNMLQRFTRGVTRLPCFFPLAANSY